MADDDDALECDALVTDHMLANNVDVVELAPLN
jgi:hypothetical protein